jgi:hypothetical protein
MKCLEFLKYVLNKFVGILYAYIIYTVYVIRNRNSFYSSITSLQVSVSMGHLQVKKCININFFVFCFVFVKDHHATLNTSIITYVTFYYYTIYPLISL